MQRKFIVKKNRNTSDWLFPEGGALIKAAYSAGSTLIKQTQKLALHVHHAFITSNLSLVVRKPVFGVSDQVRHKPSCTATEDG